MVKPGSLFLALLLPVVALSPPLPAAAKAQVARTYKIDFENEGLPARQKELLGHYADQIVQWASVGPLVKAAEAQSGRPLTMDHIHQIDVAWQRGEDPEGLATGLAHNDCAQALQSILAANPGYGEAFVCDSRGALVCMSRRTSDYWQGDEAKWTRAWAGGTGVVFVSKVAHDDSTGTDLMHISVPIRAGSRLVGVLTMGKLLAGN
ncbi:MAG TPA: PDC sensor domain-containing protein [Thermoanaerobaculia bacterium]|jgi:hypothetical protein|nr:PDC sensor domain-containing protein [Thermoanaerobaculia bacterium]